jgi:hypothetical protein
MKPLSKLRCGTAAQSGIRIHTSVHISASLAYKHITDWDEIAEDVS